MFVTKEKYNKLKEESEGHYRLARAVAGALEDAIDENNQLLTERDALLEENAKLRKDLDTVTHALRVSDQKRKELIFKNAAGKEAE